MTTEKVIYNYKFITKFKQYLEKLTIQSNRKPDFGYLYVISE